MAATLEPDLSERRLRLSVERDMAASPAALFRAWTQQFDLWFAAPGSVIIGFRHKQGLSFRDRFRRQAHPHYGRFLKLQPNALLEITWLTAATLGAEKW